MLRVKPVPGEPTRFWVESNSLQCIIPECAELFGRKMYPDLHIGSTCPKCVKRSKQSKPGHWVCQRCGTWHEIKPTMCHAKVKDRLGGRGESRKYFCTSTDFIAVKENPIGKLDIRFHVVDLGNYNGVGECGCEFFQIRLASELKGLSPARRVELAEKYRCHHIRAARDFALDLALQLHNTTQGGKEEQYG